MGVEQAWGEIRLEFASCAVYDERSFMEVMPPADHSTTLVDTCSVDQFAAVASVKQALQTPPPTYSAAMRVH
ncbi:MAG: hypothetical protein R2867_30120 [Caldilineaceae bacterium]